jgi:hypothetical protein
MLLNALLAVRCCRAATRRRVATVPVMFTVTVLVGVAVSSASAAAPVPGPAWEVSSVAHPTNFSTADNARCNANPREFCDTYLVTLTNIGSKPTNGTPVVITDTLPEGLSARRIRGESLQPNGTTGWSCTSTICEYEPTVAVGGTLVVYLEVSVTSGSGPITNVVKVEGGGAPPASTGEPLTEPNTVNGSASPFGVASFGFAAHDDSGALDLQAGDHPYDVTSTVDLDTASALQSNGLRYGVGVSETPKDIVVDVPLGLIGNPTAAAQCTEVQLIGDLETSGAFETECPPDSRVGTAVLLHNGNVVGTAQNEVTSAVYNMVPQKGYPAEFGLRFIGVPVILYASVVHTPSGYALRVANPGLPTTLSIEGAALTFFGDPHAEDGDPSPDAFFTDPGDCSAAPVRSRAEADSWTAPGQWATAEAIAYPDITGCDMLQFGPTIELHPEVTQAERPSGDEIDIKVPQSPNEFPVLATPDLKGVTMTLPEGMTISPGAGTGLVGCEATGPNGIDMPTNLPDGQPRTPTEAGEGETIGPDDMSHLTPGHCPPASQIGTVQVTTPLLEKPLEGHLFVAQPKCGGTGRPECTTADATNGSLYGLYLEAESSGVVVKFAGSVSANPETGQLTARFTENPQFPFSEVTIVLDGGGRATLANPRQCGAASANGDLTPWSSPVTPDADVSSSPFTVTWDGAHEPCPGTLPFAPILSAGAMSPAAGRFTPFTFTLTRADRQQDIARLQAKLPPGLLGMLSQVPLCEEPQAASGTCSSASEIGSVNVAAGSGPDPLWVSGHAYLTGPYGGGPFGLTVVVPAVAGPFNLGNVVVRSAITIDPSTASVTITSDTFPQILDGVLLRVQTLNVTVDRPGFMFNPTNCGGQQIATSVDAEQGSSASLSTPFSVEGCKGLPFKPSFKASTQGKTSKADGASLTVVVASKGGPGASGEEANIAKVDLQLPKQLPARLTTLQKACTEAQFSENPAGCPAASVIGVAKAITPVLSVPLTGPAILVSHGGAAFPDVEFILQGEGVQISLDGKTQIKKGITYSKFEMVPDAPVTSFETVLPEGPHSVLATDVPANAKHNLCALSKTVTVTKTVTKRVHGKHKKITVKVTQIKPQRFLAPTTITGQNGAVVTQDTKIAVTGCPTAKKKATTAGKAKRARRAVAHTTGRAGR